MSTLSTVRAMVFLALCAWASLAPRPTSAQPTQSPKARACDKGPALVPNIHAVLTPRLMSRLQWFLEEYREHNDIPALSVALNVNGETLWAQGSGVLDEHGRPAQADSVYALASISKAVTATLLGRLEERGRLSDGTSLQLSGRDLSTRWTHRAPVPSGPTLRQLMSHTGCVPHYSSAPSMPNTTKHYSHQLHSARRVTRLGSIYRCSIGHTKNYSTAGYTLLGAVLESTTWRRFSSLIQEEVSEAFGLGSLRVMYDAPTLAPNPNRATWFHRGHPVPFHNTSWKAAGGGLEGNAIDVARFGGLLAKGELVSKGFRDHTLLVRQPGSNYGYGWMIGRSLDRRHVRHGGASLGSRGELSVWPDAGLSIALLSNSRNHNGLKDLAEQMAAIWFDAVEDLPRTSGSNPAGPRDAPWIESRAERRQDAQRPCGPSDSPALPPEPSEDLNHESGCNVQTQRSAPWLLCLLMGLLRPRRRRR